MSNAFHDDENPSLLGTLQQHSLFQGLPDTLQNFLSHVGVVNAPTDSMHENLSEHFLSSSLNQSESIFESFFDLTEERLRFVFGMFDSDKDGRISYTALREGLQFHSGATHRLDETSFDYLVKHLDLDSSGDVSFDEFKEGIRLLMLRSLFNSQPVVGTESEPFAMLEVNDYDTVRFEQRRVIAPGQDLEPLASNNSNDTLTEDIFYFRRRPEWVQTRWVNIAPAGSRMAATTTMNRVAIKYLLHPLALEDALTPENHRPKAELYSNHYFIMAPVFFIEWEVVKNDAETISWKPIRFLLAVPRLLRWVFSGCPSRSSAKATAQSLKRQVRKIQSQMVSIFVNVPKNDTIITFTSGVTSKRAAMNGTDNVTDSSHQLWERVQRELEKSYSKLRQYDAQYLTYALLDEAVDLVDPIMTTMRREIDRQRITLRQEKFRDLSRIRHLKSELEKVGRKFKPFLRLLTHVIEDDAISPGATVYMRDVLDNLECSDEELGQLISECDALYSEADKVQSRQMDRALYTLTVVSAIFLPAQFLTGVWGMNFDSMPELREPWGYKMFWAISSSMMVCLIILLNFGRLR